MKESVKGVLFIILALIALSGSYFLYVNDYKGYAMVCVTGALALIVFGVRYLIIGSNPTKIYENNIKNILNTFDSVLVKSSTVPKLIGKNIILVEGMDDLIDAQLEIRKPICYYKQTESCSFVLLDDKEAYIYIEKLNSDVLSPIEIEINDIKIKQKNSEDLDSEMLKDIEKTTIVKLSNKKIYKVSPINKESKSSSEKNNENSTIEDIEIL